MEIFQHAWRSEGWFVVCVALNYYYYHHDQQQQQQQVDRKTGAITLNPSL